MIETHAHIYSDDYADDREEMLERAWNAGIQQIWMPNCDHATIDSMMALAERFPGKCLPMIGLHPTYVKDDFEKELQIVEDWLSKAQFIAIGEIGMDLFWDKTFREQQEKAFLYQCELAVRHNLWIDIHSRNAFWETVKLIEDFGNSALKGIFHCFTGTLEEANKAIELGFKIGIGGVATFKNGGLDKVIPFIDLEHIVLETDSPYLAPTPLRGKRNEVAYIDLVAQRVADLKQIPKSELIMATDHTAMNLLKK
ncbi:TatD family hydrolase [Dyadobacter sediminis]|uniref:TatD family deoxyribonuclease n=1 Tax=Dyadobacter sediminis TaxID=1493691 RepID=A0A5R9KI75_9BACT|nr:TatD family hydrolase [Dyadobacter sediminis]TLU95874.1 TatD family deoxyribonuclease [Dyadobacter sediminis]GGB77308.1 TatD family hydrolase [Dyadobacter sediminis]